MDAKLRLGSSISIPQHTTWQIKPRKYLLRDDHTTTRARIQITTERTSQQIKLHSQYADRLLDTSCYGNLIGAFM